MYVEKATLSENDPAIYNSEGVAVNQIKTNEYVLKDDSTSAWIVGYLDRDFDGFKNAESQAAQPITVKITEPPFYKEMTKDEFESTILSLNGYKATLNHFFVFAHKYINLTIGDGGLLKEKQYALSSKTNKWQEFSDPTISPFTPLTPTSSSYSHFGNIYSEVLSNFSNEVNKSIIDTAQMYISSSVGSIDTFNDILKMNGRIYKVTDPQTNTIKYYKL